MALPKGSPQVSDIRQIVAKAIVGSAAQVANSTATHTSIQGAINAISDGDSIYILPGTYTENVTVSKRVQIFGSGYDSMLTGTLALSAGTANFSNIRHLRLNGNVTINSSYCFLMDFYLVLPATINDLGTSNAVFGISI